MLNDTPTSLVVHDEPAELVTVDTVEIDLSVPGDLSLEEKLDKLLSILEPLEPFIASLPAMVERVDPLMEALSQSPVLRMLGVRLP